MSATIDRLTITTRDVLEMNAHDGAAARAVIAALEAAAPIHVTYIDHQDRVRHSLSAEVADATRTHLTMRYGDDETTIRWFSIIAVELNLGMTEADRWERQGGAR